MLTTNYYNDFFEFGQQKINFSFFELSLPDDDPVYTLKKVMEELDFSGLLANCSDKGRTGYNPIMMYAVVTYANTRGIRSVDRIVDLCERDLAFIWLTRGQKPRRDAFYDFKSRKLTSDVLDDLNYQFMRRLQKEGLVTLKELFIDGTKIEANANRYTFVWRGSINYHLAGLLDSIDQLFEKYNSFLQENDYGTKYELGNAQMFVIEGMDKVRSVIEKNRKRKLSKHKKLANNTVIEIDNCSPLEILKLQDHEKRKTRAYAEDISKYYNMKVEVFEDEQFYSCHDGRELRHIRTETKEQNGDTQTFEVYSCADCSGCEHKARCLYKYNAEKDTERNKVMKINEQWEELREKSHANIQSERGILKRQTRSIQTEGHFGDIKENENFRRFNYRSADKVYKEFMLYAIVRNINKYCRFLNEKLKKFEGKTV